MAAEDIFLTVEEATDRLPLVRAIVQDAMALKRDVLARQDRLRELRERYPDEDNDDSPYADEVIQMEESLEADEIRVDEYCQELQQIGARLVCAETGLVEFAASRDGDGMWLSWKFDEPGVAFWRSGNDGPADRRPLEPAGHTH